MDSVYFQVLFKQKTDFSDLLQKSLLQISRDNNGPINEDNFSDFLTLNYAKQLSNNRFLVGFKIAIEDNMSIDLIKTFCDSLTSELDCEFIIKFKDKLLFNSLNKLYEQIFKIEMKLREVLSYIFISVYENDCYAFLEFQRQKVNPMYPRLNPKLKEEEIPSFLKKKYQNEFFFLTFNQYKQLKLPDVIKSQTLINLLSDPKCIDDLKKDIWKIGVLKVEKNIYLEFLNKISENLESIEAIRNCVAHNREPSEQEMDNYNLAKQKLEKELDNFIVEIKIKEVIYAKIYLEMVGQNIGVYRQNSTNLEYENGDSEEVDFGDMEEYFDSIDHEDIEPRERFKDHLISYLKKNNYNIKNLDRDSIEIDFMDTL